MTKTEWLANETEWLANEFESRCRCPKQDRNFWRIYDSGEIVCYKCGMKFPLYKEIGCQETQTVQK